ncbi:MAG: 2-hydroxyacyl-CoA dehydratase [Armatimonadota bacterium]
MRVGLTSTIPVEFVLAAGDTPVDLNNIFVTSPEAHDMVREAELQGFPRNACAWVKGIYSTILAHDISRVIVVTQGDCSQMHAMMESLRSHDVEFIPFAYPYDQQPEALEREMKRLAEAFEVTWEDAERQKEALRPLREKVADLDAMTWRDNLVTGCENHLYQVNCSDFGGDPEAYERKLDAFLAEAEKRSPLQDIRGRVGFVGVPPIYSDLYDFLHSLGIHVCFNEMQRQFTMAPCLDCDLLTQYLCYTYPYDIFKRLEDITRETTNRRIDGVIHYVQSFCFRQIYDHILRQALDCPVLTLEGDQPGALTARDRLRLEAFAETLEARR